MIDSNFSKYVYSDKPATKYNTFLPDVHRFNPYETIPGKTPISCYETLAIMNDLDVVPCCRNIVPTGIVCADLDETEGFSIAITGRLKSSLIYGLCNTKLRRKWDFATSGLQSSRFDLNSSCSRTLVANVCRDDPRGIGLSYLTLTDKSDVELLCEMRCTIHVLATEGSCLIRVSNFNNSKLRRYLSPLKDIFETLVFYKPAVTPCMEPICYAVGIRRIIELHILMLINLSKVNLQIWNFIDKDVLRV